MSHRKAESPEIDIGSVEMEGPAEVVAGSHATFRITFRAGLHGVDDSGEIRLSWRWASDAGTPQFDDPAAPDYCSVAASNGIALRVRYDPKGNVRPWGKTIVAILTGGYLSQDDTITVTLGDTSGGSPGWRVQTFCEREFRFRLFSDRHATYVFEEVGEIPPVAVVAGEVEKTVAVAPTVVAAGEAFAVHVKREDRWGNPTGPVTEKPHDGFGEPGVHRADSCGVTANPVIVRAQGDEGPGRYWADFHAQSTETIGTGTVEDYFAFARDRAFLDIASHQGNDFQVTDAFWRRLQGVTAGMYEPGRFVTFPGYEFSPNTGLGGDHNVIYLEEGPEAVVSRSCRALVSEGEASFPDSPTIEDLYRNLEGRDALVFAHVGGRYADAARDSGQERFAGVEIHSAWGTFEWIFTEALERGDRVAVFANSDGHKGRPGASYPGASMFGSYGGLTCVLAGKLDRASVWQAIRERHTYATTGARIYMDIRTSGGAVMGDVAELSGPESLAVRVAGSGALELVEILDGHERLALWRPGGTVTGRRLKVSWEGAERRGRGRATTFDGRLALDGNAIESFEPVNFHNPERSLSRTGTGELEWQCITTGGVAGVILTLSDARSGRLEVRTKQGDLEVDLGALPDEGASAELGGLGRRIRARWLPDEGGEADAELGCGLSGLAAGEHPVYVKVTQEDGHMAWSSPVYCVVG